jgi:pimeloyl-ACP methyl ester carboxylesterase
MIAGCAHDADGDPAQVAPTPHAQVTSDVAPPAAVIESIQIRVDALTFDALAAGPRDGTPVILLHGFPQNAREWLRQIPLLAQQGYRVVAPDQRGYSAGARPTDVAQYGSAQLVADVLGMADALGFSRFHLVGHDWGANVAWATALTAPARLLSVTPISVPHPAAFSEALSLPDGCQPKASSYIPAFVAPSAEQTLRANDSARLRAIYRGLPVESIEAYVRYFSGPALTGGLNWYRAGLAPRTGTAPRAAGSVTVPTMYVWSDGDTALCRDGAVRTEKYVSGPYRFEVIAGVNHWVPELAADALNDLLIDHLAKYTPAP